MLIRKTSNRLLQFAQFKFSSLAIGLLLAFSSSLTGGFATISEKPPVKSGLHHDNSDRPPKKREGNESVAACKTFTDNLAKLTLAIEDYKLSPNDDTYTKMWQTFEGLARQSIERHNDISSLCASCQSLSKAGLKAIEVGGSKSIKIYTFRLPFSSKPTIDTRDILIQYTEVGQIELSGSQKSKNIGTSHGKKGKVRSRIRKTKRTVSITHLQRLHIPGSVEIKQAWLYNSAPSKNHALAIIGLDSLSGHYWLEGLKHISNGWVHTAELWQQVPSFLIEGQQCKLGLSENGLIITIGNGGAADNNSVPGYQLVMPFIENHFSLTRNETQDPARAVALQLLMAIQAKRPDLIKIWVIDPQLSSIPGYLGLYERPAGSLPYKLITMSPPLTGGSRFRLITSSKDDLIIDVAKIKGQWLIKGLFIAPADYLSKEIGRMLPAETGGQ